jgi:6-hydroxycyclohex-1-ene-1-carbonyl-CoA dehydrogenase
MEARRPEGELVVDIRQWELRSPKEPLAASERRVGTPAAGEALVRVSGCGVCHTDLGFYLGQVPTKHALPLVLGHEVSGVVEAAGPGAEGWTGKRVVVPAVLPCGECGACRRGRYALCPGQIFPGNDVHGGFASHLVVPARFLCDLGRVDDSTLPLYAVVADAVSTPYEAVRRSGLREGDLAIFVGAGGVGGFGVQIAAALGAQVVAIEPAPERRLLATRHGAGLALDPKALDGRGLRQAVRGFADGRGLPSDEWKVFETSGTTAGQEIAFGLMTRGSHLGVVGYTPEKVPLHLSRLMALDARAEGNWGCAPGRYPELLRLIERGAIALEPFVELRPMEQINQVLAEMIDHRLQCRAVLIPQSSGGRRPEREGR